MKKYNCWEFKKCGREAGGEMSNELGVCPVTLFNAADGLNGGVNGGRICWIIDRNGCKDRIMHGKDFCFQCEFRYMVTNEEGMINVCKATGLYLNNESKKNNTDES